jgi:1-acyl-sn-glycerol-3-phosphate acyltransferase
MTNDKGTTTGERASADRSRLAMAWYRVVQVTVATFLSSVSGIRATGRDNLPRHGGALLVSNHLSHLDVFILGIPLNRPLNYVARSTLFLPVLGSLIRSVGGFPIQREGIGAQGLKETLRRLKKGGIVVLFPEGTRSRDGELGELKSGISVLAARAHVAVIPAGIAGTFEAWPRTRPFPRPHPIRIHYGPPILPEELEGLDPEAITSLIRARILECLDVARSGLRRDMQRDVPCEAGKTAVGRIGKMG